MDDFESSQFDNLLPTQAHEKNSSDEPAESSLFKKITSDANTGGWKLDSSSQVIKNGLLKGYGKNLFDEKKQAVINTNILVAGNVNHDNIEAVKKARRYETFTPEICLYPREDAEELETGVEYEPERRQNESTWWFS